jgi:hypothetical protein
MLLVGFEDGIRFICLAWEVGMEFTLAPASDSENPSEATGASSLSLARGCSGFDDRLKFITYFEVKPYGSCPTLLALGGADEELFGPLKDLKLP